MKVAVVRCPVLMLNFTWTLLFSLTIKTQSQGELRSYFRFQDMRGPHSGQGVGVDFTFVVRDNNNNNNKNHHIDFLGLRDKGKGIGSGVKGQGSRIKVNGQGARDKGLRN